MTSGLDARGYDVTSTSFVPVVTDPYAVGDSLADGVISPTGGMLR